jgi:2-polyprenyl-3-methyl-5-hydroxy-6-metoxy-1,4-benzoquinol methylase
MTANSSKIKISREFKESVYNSVPNQYKRYAAIGPYCIPLFGRIYWRRLEIAIELSKQYAPNKHLVIGDLGCGFGILSTLLNVNFDATVVAIDERPELFESAKKFCEAYSGKQTLYVANDLQHLIIKDGTFDLCFCLDVLEHVEDATVALQEIKRVMKSPGHAIITVPIEARSLQLLRELYSFGGKKAENNPHWKGEIANIREFEACLADQFNISLKRRVPNRVVAYDMLYVCST